MATIKNMEVNGRTLEVRSWFVEGFEKNGLVFDGKGSNEIVKVDGESAIDFFMKHPTEYFDLCKAVQA